MSARLCFLATFVLFWLNAISVNAGEFNAGKMADDAPKELMHWGQLVGQWSTTEESLTPDGSAWAPSKGADWDFFWSFDGWGIQDSYTSPPISVTLADERKRQRGINLRIYNPSEKKWVLTWLTTGSSKPLAMTARSTPERIVMLSDDKDPRGNYQRFTFFDISDDKFEWTLEWSQDKEHWQTVHKIHATKKRQRS